MGHPVPNSHLQPQHLPVRLLTRVTGAVTPEVMLATPEATSGAAQLHKPPRKEGKELFAPLRGVQDVQDDFFWEGDGKKCWELFSLLQSAGFNHCSRDLASPWH